MSAACGPATMSVRRRKAYGRYWQGMVRMKSVMGWSHVSRTEVVMNERAREEARTWPDVMNRFSICTLLDTL